MPVNRSGGDAGLFGGLGQGETGWPFFLDQGQGSLDQGLA
jgi:hypothetical protein